MLAELIQQNRSYRRFQQEVNISIEHLHSWINLARLSASARNAQPLKYIVVNEEPLNAKVFSTLKWAAALENWEGPKEGERPAAYIIQLHDTTISNNYFCDDGIALQSIMLGAVEKGFGGCIMGAINKTRLREILKIDDFFSILHVVALGKPNEKVVTTNMVNEDFNYWRDKDEIHYVPKRNLKTIII